MVAVLTIYWLLPLTIHSLCAFTQVCAFVRRAFPLITNPRTMSALPSALKRSPQYLNEYRGDTLITISALFIALESISVILRVYARTITTSTIGWDDILIPLGWLANIGLCVLGIS